MLAVLSAVQTSAMVSADGTSKVFYLSLAKGQCSFFQAASVKGGQAGVGYNGSMVACNAPTTRYSNLQAITSWG